MPFSPEDFQRCISEYAQNKLDFIQQQLREFNTLTLEEKGLAVALMDRANRCWLIIFAISVGDLKLTKLLTYILPLGTYCIAIAPVQAAIACHQEAIIDYFLKENPRWNVLTTGAGETPLVFACNCGAMSLVESLLRLDMGSSYISLEGRSPEFLALLASYYDPRSYTLLRKEYIFGAYGISWGVELLCSKRIWEGRLSDLHKAAMYGDVAKVNNLISAGADPNSLSQEQQTPLMLAIANGYVEVAQLLMHKYEVTVEPVDDQGWSALTYAARAGLANLITELVIRGADANTRTKDGSTPLLIAATFGHVSAVKALLMLTDRTAPERKLVDIKACDKFGWNALHLAAAFNFTQLAELLVANWSKEINDETNAGDAPLLFAIYNGNRRMIDVLCSSKFLAKRINQPNKHGLTPLYMALTPERINLPIVERLLACGANPNLVAQSYNVNGETALQLAIMGGGFMVANILLEAGASVNAVDKRGQAALSYALTALNQAKQKELSFKERYREIVGVLLACGADPTKINLKEVPKELKHKFAEYICLRGYYERMRASLDNAGQTIKELESGQLKTFTKMLCGLQRESYADSAQQKIFKVLLAAVAQREQELLAPLAAPVMRNDKKHRNKKGNKQPSLLRTVESIDLPTEGCSSSSSAGTVVRLTGESGRQSSAPTEQSTFVPPSSAQLIATQGLLAKPMQELPKVLTLRIPEVPCFCLLQSSVPAAIEEVRSIFKDHDASKVHSKAAGSAVAADVDVIETIVGVEIKKRAISVAENFQDAIVVITGKFICCEQELIAIPHDTEEARKLLKQFVDHNACQVAIGVAIIDVARMRRIFSYYVSTAEFDMLEVAITQETSLSQLAKSIVTEGMPGVYCEQEFPDEYLRKSFCRYGLVATVYDEHNAFASAVCN